MITAAKPGSTVRIRQRNRNPHPDIVDVATVTETCDDGTLIVRVAPDEVGFYVGPNMGWEVEEVVVSAPRGRSVERRAHAFSEAMKFSGDAWPRMIAGEEADRIDAALPA